MPFLVHGRDAPGALARLRDLTEEHWSYMDRFADRLILRGPTLSEDGEEHTGSVHVVDLPDRAAAERFASEEPYWLAGLYERVVVERTVVLRRGADITREVPNALVVGRWPARPMASLPTVEPDAGLGFLGVLVTDDQAGSTGIVATVSVGPADAVRFVRPIADQVAGGRIALTAQRWERGGRR